MNSYWLSSIIYNETITVIDEQLNYGGYGIPASVIEFPNCIKINSILNLQSSLTLISFQNLRYIHSMITNQNSLLSLIYMPNLYYNMYPIQLRSTCKIIASNARRLDLQYTGNFTQPIDISLSRCSFLSVSFVGGTGKISSLNIPSINILSIQSCALPNFINNNVHSIYFYNISSLNTIDVPNARIVRCFYCSDLTQVYAPTAYSVTISNCGAVSSLSFSFACSVLITSLYSLHTLSLSRVSYVGMGFCSSFEKLILADYLPVTQLALAQTPTFTDSTILGHYASIYVRSSLISTYTNRTVLSSIVDRFVAIETLPIIFSIGLNSFSALWGTKWNDWVMSSYNTMGYQVIGNSIYTSDGTQSIAGVTSLSEIIDDGIVYSLI